MEDILELFGMSSFIFAHKNFTHTSSSSNSNANDSVAVKNDEKSSIEKVIQAKLITNVSTVLGEGVTAEQTKELVASNGNKISITPIAKNGNNIGVVITTEGSSLVTTIPIDKDSGKVAAVYKYLPLLDKYIKLSDGVVIGTNTITLPTQANATYIASTSEILTTETVTQGWTKVANN